MPLALIAPSLEHLDAYVVALRKGFSPNNLEAERTRRAELARITLDPKEFIASMDGSRVEDEIRRYMTAISDRIPGFCRWLMRDDEFIGSYGFRWVPSSDTLPPHVPGHVGYAIVEWERRKGYASWGLKSLMDEIRTYGLSAIEVTIEAGNIASIGVAKACGAIFDRRLEQSRYYPDGHEDVYRISLAL